jgi:hypothetical protein
VTALLAVGNILLAAEGPYLRFYYEPESGDCIFLGSKKVLNDHAIHGFDVNCGSSDNVIIAIWGGPYVRFVAVDVNIHSNAPSSAIVENLVLSPTVKAPDWILDLSFGLKHSSIPEEADVVNCAAVTAHNALVELTVQCSSGAYERSDDTSKYVH